MKFSEIFNSLSFGWYLHCFFATLLFIGIVLLIIWMVKNLKKKDLMNWIIILIVVGVLGTVLTMNASIRGWKFMMNFDKDFDEKVSYDIE